MFSYSVLLAAILSGSSSLSYAQYTATYLPSNAPDHSENGQYGTNKCGSDSSQDSNCQNLYVNGIDDFCLFSPPKAGVEIAADEQVEVAWCTKQGYGTRVFPEGTFKGVHFLETPDFVQVTGFGDFTKIGVPAGDQGGELDPHGADGNGNPIGGLVFSSAFGQLQQIHEWTNFMSADEFCIRACKPGPMATTWCQHIYDTEGCQWNMPANYDIGSFDSCKGTSGEPMGVYGDYTFMHGDASTPAPHAPPKSSDCVATSTIVGGIAAANPTSSGSSSGGVTSTGASTSSSTSASGSVSATSSVSQRSTASTSSRSTGTLTSPTVTATNTSSAAPKNIALNAAVYTMMAGIVSGVAVGFAYIF